MPSPLRVLFVTSELYPLVKTGGLADVSGALPLALKKLGVDVRVLLPAYPSVLERVGKTVPVANLGALSGKTGAAQLLQATLPGTDLTLYLLDCRALFNRAGGPYLTPDGHDWPDNVLRFGLLSQVGALLGKVESPLSWRPDVVHCNDWQTGLIPALLHFSKAAHARTVMSIHNLMYQGRFEQEWVTRLGLPASSFKPEGVEFYGSFSFLKAGLYYADKISTVSRTYAQEIQTNEFGSGMDGLLRHRRADLLGILNGVGDDWNPATDQFLYCQYDASTLARKKINKQKLLEDLGLATDENIPLLGVTSRLTQQKGIDLVLDCAHDLLHEGAQIVFLGSGDEALEQRIRDLVRQYPGRASATLGYDEELAHRIVAGSDIFLMPSRFEPCGLNQMYAMAYGTLPVVRNTGGLADTVVGSEPGVLHVGDATGFVFSGQSSSALMYILRHALSLYREKDIWRALQMNGMEKDFSWAKAAAAYIQLYQDALRSTEEGVSNQSGTAISEI